MNRDVVVWCVLAVILSVADAFGDAAVTLSWTAPGDDGRTGQASIYDLRYSLTPITEANWSSAVKVWGLPSPGPAGSRETFIVTGLANSTTYYFALKSGDEVPNWSPMSNVVSRTTPAAPPAAPVLVSPAAGSTGVSSSPTLTWTASAGATSYRVQVSADAGFASTLVDTSGVTTTTLAIAGLGDGTVYYWRVNASNSGGTSGYSSVGNFTTLSSPLTAPVLASPANGATGIATDTTLRWKLMAGANSYRVQVSTEATFGATVVDQSDIVDTFFALSGLALNTPYYWRVSAANAIGAGPNSSVWSFTTMAELPPVSPTELSPANGATGVYINPTLIWSGSENAKTYHVQVSTTPSFGSYAIDQNGLGDTAFYIASLKGNTTYYWRVSASNSGGSSPYSAVQKFKTSRKKRYVTYGATGSPGKSNDGSVPDAYDLKQNYPNPFNPTTTIEFDLPAASDVKIDVFNVLGQVVCRLIQEPMDAGTHVVVWNARNDEGVAVASGIYFYRLSAGDFVATRKMLLLR
ncbi:hypothetical protein C3F09_10795 [candidate division GN15 bacterium]|uniref:Fibronectin type-III domain-containing protein n=1 Tax=candidate division GN15 bacterium TaxID=2072418 RepID=A0A855WW40_9BACT|nr:MAG: hypothetical protein C3F09_10795 [candidate division GN15 bacterium]